MVITVTSNREAAGARPKAHDGGCGECVCLSCLMYHSGRCPYGGCWDDLRAIEQPYTEYHSDIRKTWTNWNKPGEQEHWCRGGICYEFDGACPSFIRFDPARKIVRTCLLANVEKFQDGFIRCSIIDSIGCEECYRRFEEEQKNE